MQRKFIFIGTLLAVLPVGMAYHLHSNASNQVPQSPYVQQLPSSVRGLSTQEIDNLRNGRGAGFARMAELNSYPGPSHVLDLKEQLNLSTEQTQRVQAAFQKMDTEAKRTGQEIIEHEQQLSQVFAKKKITATELQKQTTTIAALYGKLRATHLQAHLEITPLLSSEQIVTYNTLRGYTKNEVPANHHHKN